MSPVDTKPLNRSRRALLLLFMLVLFLSSLGVAKMIVKERTKTIAKGFYFDIPAGFEAVEVTRQTQHTPVLACSTLKRDRHFVVFQSTIAGPVDLTEQAYKIYRAYMRADPSSQADTHINRYPATNLSGPVGRGFATITATAADKRFVAVLYFGSTPPTERDETLFRNLTEESITFFGHPGK